jgi:hypothetical protein
MTVDKSSQRLRTLGWVAAAASLWAIIAIIFFGTRQSAPWIAVATGLAVMGAAEVSGALLGFLFGIPRVLAADQFVNHDSPQNQTSDAIVANTNLEQISDWLTKILVGVGLTQFGEILSGAGRLFATVGPSLGAGSAATVFAGGIILYSIATGFAVGWLFTSLHLGRAMAEEASRMAALRALDAAIRAENIGDSNTSGERVARSSTRFQWRPYS